MAKAKDAGNYNVAIGDWAGAGLKGGARNFFLGERAGEEVTDECDLILIGDYVKSPDNYPEGTILIGVKPGEKSTPPFRVFLGPVLFDRPVAWLPED